MATLRVQHSNHRSRWVMIDRGMLASWMYCTALYCTVNQLITLIAQQGKQAYVCTHTGELCPIRYANCGVIVHLVMIMYDVEQWSPSVFLLFPCCELLQV